MRQIIFALLFSLLWLSQTLKFTKLVLSDDWKMIVTEGPTQAQRLLNKVYNVTVPSTIHLNLQKNQQITDPFFGDNIKNVQWISSCKVTFKTTIKITGEQLKYSRANLLFEGIDTYSDIYVNSNKLGSTKNAFLKYQYEIKKYLINGDNQIEVRINSTKLYDAEGQKKYRMPFQYAHTRKACYQYSWDWAPYMNTMGIWLPVTLNLFEEVKFDYIWIRNKNISETVAILDMVIALDSQSDRDFSKNDIKLKLKRLDDKSQKILYLSAQYSNTQISVINPKLWWPNNIGEPHVYQFDLTLYKNDIELDNKRIVYGIKTVRLDQQKRNFKLIINGYPIYAKGANYVPPDMMYPRVNNPTFNPKNTIFNLLEDAVISNFNMLRVWGGGQYESDQFYELASRKGIMIFQDFMFSDSIYPSHDQFLLNVKDQVVYQIRRLRNYPCIVLWSGNNQILQGIHSWGWGQPQYVANYQKIFKSAIPNIINMESSSIPYIQSSPSRGVGNTGFETGGDIHFWGVWAAGGPFETYEIAIGGFNSEFGTQSLPVWESINQFTTSQDHSFKSTVMLTHERHNSQFRTLQNYLKRYSKNALNFQGEVYNSGLVQAYAIEIAIRAQRISKPLSYGTLYWQFNDAWPAISWSSIDYYGRWKPLQYKAKQLYSDIILFYHPRTRDVIAISDKLYPVSAIYLVQVMTFDGQILHHEQGNIKLNVDDKIKILTVPESALNGKQKKCFIFTQIVYGKKENEKTSIVTFVKPYKELDIDDAILNVKYIYDTNEMELSSNYLIKSVKIGNSRVFLKYSDNYVDVIPHHPIKIKVYGNEPISQLKAAMVFQSYRQIYDPASLRVTTQN